MMRITAVPTGERGGARMAGSARSSASSLVLPSFSSCRSTTYWVAMPAYGWRLPSLPARVAGGLGVPVPAEESMVLNWRGPPGSFRRIPFADFYYDILRKNRERPADELKNK